MKPDISVIVPVYNVEKYLAKCIQSILRQSLVNFELILVNDGSTDNSAEICDEFSKMDIRVIVIHQQNGGPGKARNNAIDIAKGDYITFVDSDDWIDDDMLQEMYDMMITNCVDIVVASHYTVSLENVIEKVANIETDKLIDKTEATKLILEDKIIYSFAWDKLYKRELFKGVRYPEKRIIEDIATTYKLINNAGNVFLSTNAYYYYVRRTTSSCLNPDPRVTMERKLDYFNGFYERYEFACTNKEYHSVLDDCQAKAFSSGQQLLHYIANNKLKKFNNSFEIILNKLSQMNISSNKHISSTLKLEHAIMKSSRTIYLLILNVYFLKHKLRFIR